jgi:flagellar biosynthesis protein FlhB
VAEDLGDKTEDPTGNKLSEARGRGQVARSQDLAAAFELIGATLLIALLGAFLWKAMLLCVDMSLTNAMGTLQPQDILTIFRTTFAGPLLATAPILIIMLLIAVASHIVQFGLVWTSYPLIPKLDRLNPINGLQNIFSRRNAVKTGVNSVKMLVVVLVAYQCIANSLPQMASLPMLGLHQLLAVMGMILLKLLIWLLVILLVIGLIDYLYQRWQHSQDLRMTKHEVQDERKNTDGDPQTKSRRMRMAREIALQQVNRAVPQADVVVTNPTHFSIALRYDQESMRAPRVVAKGVDHMAMRIRQVALVHKIPLVERPPLARALYASVEVGREIDPEFYQAVAEVLAYVYRLDRSVAAEQETQEPRVEAVPA